MGTASGLRDSRADRSLPAPGLHWLGRRDYEAVWCDMRRFTAERDAATPDQIWFVEHPPVFTLGLSGNREHVLAAGDIPIVHCDRGGQVTYHGPGQLVVYPLIDLRRLALGIRDLVTALEQAVCDTVAAYHIEAVARPDAPGVYAGGRKLASLGLRVRRGSSYHGLALNVAMDLEPFSRINPCGFRDLAMTQLVDLGGPDELETVMRDLTPHLLRRFGYPDDSG